jgi:hypothetical protein
MADRLDCTHCGAKSSVEVRVENYLKNIGYQTRFDCKNCGASWTEGKHRYRP